MRLCRVSGGSSVVLPVLDRKLRALHILLSRWKLEVESQTALDSQRLAYLSRSVGELLLSISRFNGEELRRLHLSLPACTAEVGDSLVNLSEFLDDLGPTDVATDVGGKSHG